MTRTFTFAEARAAGHTVIGDQVFDLTGFAARHPGGASIGELRGTDATLPMINAHGIQGEMPRLPGKLAVGKLDPETLDPVDRDLRAMWRDFQARGLFRYRTSWLVMDVARGLGLFALGALAAPFSRLVAFAILTVALLNVMWWVHDVCHDSVFAQKKQARRWAELASMLFVGTPVLDYQYVMHRLHHGFTNVIGADQALETGPVIWDERMRGRSSAAFVALQAWAWFLVVLPLTFPLFLVMAVAGHVKKRDRLGLVLVAARWGAAYLILGAHLGLLVASVCAAAYLLAFFSSLNHFHKPIADKLDASFARGVTRVTQNLSPTGPVLGWLSGGLDFHIEHHLFATMPRRNYRVIAPEVQAFCARHRLEYGTCSFPEAIAQLWNKLRRPFGAELSPRTSP